MSDSPRTLYQARLDLDYEIEVTSRHAKFFRLVQKGVGATGILGVAAVLKEVGELSTALSAVGASIALGVLIIDYWLAPAESAKEFELMNRLYRSLKARSESLDLKQLDHEMRQLDVDKPPEYESLRWVAYHANLRARGREDFIRAGNIKAFHKVMDFLS